MIKTVDEFKGMNPKTVANCIEGTPYISTVPVEPGLTNAMLDKNGQRIVGFNTESQEINEGLARFDIVFYVRTKDGLSLPRRKGILRIPATMTSSVCILSGDA